MMDELGFALVGCGAIGELNAASIVAADGARLVRAVDARRDMAEAIAGRYDAAVSTSLDHALADSDVDAVFIATPHDLHAPMILQAAHARRHVIVEKPIATDAAEAAAAADACAQAGVSLSVCHPKRYDPKVAFAAHLAEQGLLGRVLVTASAFLKEKTAAYWHEAPWRACPTRSGGGVVMMNLAHHLDALQMITGTRVIRAVGLTDAHGVARIEETAALCLAYEGGAVGTIAASSRLSGPKVFQDAVYGELGRVIVEKHAVRLFTSQPSSHGPPGQWVRFEFDEDVVSKTRFVQDFAAAVARGASPPVSAEYGLDLLELVLQAYGATPQRTGPPRSARAQQ